jgi:alpha,alpha-trehalase
MASRRNDRIQTAGPLFELVQLLHLYPDSKRFPDSRPKRPIPEIEARVQRCLEEWAARWDRSDGREVGLEASTPMARAIHSSRELLELGDRFHRLMDDCFDGPTLVPERGHESGLGDTMEQHIDAMWERLTRPPEEPVHGGTLLPIPHPYVVPGGRCIEFYYWDTHFTSLGLVTSGRIGLFEGMVANMANLVEQNGFVPCGTRTYYLTRSQPPFFGHMLRLLASTRGEEAARHYAEALRREYEFWRSGPRAMAVSGAPEDLLSRYWDDCSEPRPEGYREDRRTWREARDGGFRDDPEGLFRDIRTATESGWDFSSRWLARDEDGRWSLARIRTTSIVPIDLNCLLCGVESQLADWSSGAEAAAFRTRAQRRRERLRRPPFWNSETGWFHDAHLSDGALEPTEVESLAGVFPLYCRLAENEQAARVARRIERSFLKPGGVVATTDACRSGQQWDFPNGWPPLQWVTVAGLCHYGYRDLAREIASRFVHKASAFYERTGAVMEKYNVCQPERLAGGGEYPNQEGFGWTNGVVLALLRFLDSGDILE